MEKKLNVNILRRKNYLNLVHARKRRPNHLGYNWIEEVIDVRYVRMREQHYYMFL